VNAAAGHLSANRTAQAILSLESFGRYLGALSPAKVSEASAADLQEFTAEIVSLLEDSSKPAVPSAIPCRPSNLEFGGVFPVAGGRVLP